MHKEIIPRSIFSVNFKKRFSFFLLIVLTIHTEEATIVVEKTTIESDQIVLKVTSSDDSSIKITTPASLNNGVGTASPQTPAADTDGKEHTLTWSSLSADTEYTVSLSKVQLTSGATPLAGTNDGDYSEQICTKPEDAKSGSVVDGETTTNQVKITWTNPASLGSIKVKRGGTEDTITDTDVNEYIFTGLPAEDSATCEVTILGSGPCSSEESATALSIANCDTKHADLVAAETITPNEIKVDFSLSNGNAFTIATNSLELNGNVATGTNDGTTAAATQNFVWNGLSPDKKYELALGAITDTVDSKKVADAKTLTYCTLPEPATLDANQGVTGATTSEITIKWTNPTSLGGIKVSWGSTFETTLTDTSLTEYTFKESSDGKPLAAGSKGSCKVIILGSVDCNLSESSVLEIKDCNTKSFTPRIELSLSVFLVCILNYFVSIDN